VAAGWNVSGSVRSQQTVCSTCPLLAEMSGIGKWRDVSTELVAQDRTALLREGAPDIPARVLHVGGGLAATVGTGATSRPDPKKPAGPQVLDSPQGS
jgi:hypothetical protein